MVGISNSERKRRADIKELEEKLKQEMPLYVFKGLRGNLNTLLRKQEKAEADRKATAKERAQSGGLRRSARWVSWLARIFRGTDASHRMVTSDRRCISTWQRTWMRWASTKAERRSTPIIAGSSGPGGDS